MDRVLDFETLESQNGQSSEKITLCINENQRITDILEERSEEFERCQRELKDY